MSPNDSTPLLVMDLDAVADAYAALSGALPGITVHYAMKCNPHRDVLTTLRALGCRFEIASASELDLLLDIGVEPAEILYSNPVKPIEHIVRAYQAGVRRYAFDSVDELAKLAAAAPGSAVIVRLAVRGQDSLDSGLDSGLGSEVPSEGKFGVDVEDAIALLLAARDLGLRPDGVAFHVGSQMMSPEAWRPPLRLVGDVMAKLLAQDVTLRMVDLGGGFPARYGVAAPPLADYAEAIAAGLAELPYPVQAVIEPGRALVAEAGTLTATVIGIAHRFGTRWVHLDVGAFNGLMESLETGNRLRYPLSDSRRGPVRSRCHLTGPTCDSQDTILFDAELSADLATGDRVYIGSTGAYTTVYASGFNGFGAPALQCVTATRRPVHGMTTV
jgi:ornithine decarboxylase